jgi:hypothetical protein
VRLEQLAHAREGSAADRRHELFGGRLRERLDFALHLPPTVETVPARDDELGIGELQRVGLGRLRVQRANAQQRLAVARARRAQQLLGALLLHLEVRACGERLDERGILIGCHDDASHEGCPVSAMTGWRFVRPVTG